MPTPSKRTPKRDARFFAALADGRSIAQAARSARYGPASVYRWRKADPAFAQRWADAHMMAVDLIENEADRRARDGVEQSVYYRDRRVGMARRFSDGLLLARLKALRPEVYRDDPPFAPQRPPKVARRELMLQEELLRLLAEDKLAPDELSDTIRADLARTLEARANREPREDVRE